MAWMTDEEWEYTQDCKDKKITARSARNKRTHNGKGGAVKFPSDYLSKKELKAMNGPVESYRMNDPMSWDEFKRLPDDLKVTYVKALREKYKVPDSALAEAMGVSTHVFGKWMRCYGLGAGKGSGAAGRHWYNTPEHDQFVAWWNGVSIEAVDSNSEDANETVKEAEAAAYCDNDIAVTKDDVKENGNMWPENKKTDKMRCETHCAVPLHGAMTFEGPIDDILRTIGMLLSGQNVHINIDWNLMKE